MSEFITDIRYTDILAAVPEEYHRHNMYQMLFIRSGSISLETGGCVYNCSAPCAVFISSLELHRVIVQSSVYERYIVSIDPVSAANEIKPSSLLSVFTNRRTDFCHYLSLNETADEFERILRHIASELAEPNDNSIPGVSIWFSALMCLIYRLSPSLYRSAESRTEKTVNAVMQELETNLSEELNLDDIATKYFISRYYLSHIFKDISGYSVKQYRLLCRISYSRELLRMTNLPISLISARCGFNDTSNFTRYFRMKTGMSPSEYRTTGKTAGWVKEVLE